MVMQDQAWNGFAAGEWQRSIDVRSFIQKNWTPYLGDDAFLAGPTQRTKAVWKRCEELLLRELKDGILDVDTHRVSGIDNYAPGYIDRENEVIVGLQTDAPLKRIVNLYGGTRMAKSALEQYGYQLDPEIEAHFTEYRKTHNEGVFDAYPERTRAARHAGLLTGLPDAYGRGRIIGDYRRVALYGVDRLIEWKKRDLEELDGPMGEERIRLREEVSEQIRALGKMKDMASHYGVDLSRPAANAHDAIQALYMAYLAGIKENNGAATSLGRTSTFVDIYLQRDLENGVITEEEAQELVDQFIIKLRLVRHLRTPEYNELFGGDPTWVTESIGGMSIGGKTLVTRTSFRYLHTLTNLGSAPEPNLTVLWSEHLPEGFKRYCAKMSIATDSIQYENDDVMRPVYGDDYAIACCVSAMAVGKQMQFFGARCNIAKCLLYAINGGVDEMNGHQVGPKYRPITSEYLDYDEVMEKYMDMMKWLAGVYVNALNIIHYMHDKYCYESLEMALHDKEVTRWFATGIAGFSVVADSLSAIKYAKVKVIRNEQGLAVDYEVEGDYPKYGNDDDRVDEIAKDILHRFINYIREYPTYRNGIHTTSILTITSNVSYGKNTGSTPDGRKGGEPFAPGANPMHGRDSHGAVASLASVAKIPFMDSQDGISNTFSIVPDALGKNDDQRVTNLVGLMDGYFGKHAHHLNVNVLNRETLLDAQAHPELYPQLTIRVSGYAVNFIKLTRAQQDEVISRTFHERM